MSKIEIYDWRPGALKISLTKLIRSKTGLGLARAKAKVDHVLEGQAFILEVPSDETEAVIKEITELGWICRELGK